MQKLGSPSTILAMNKINEIRSSKRARVWIIVVLLILAAIAFVVFEKARMWILGGMFVLIAALGLEVAEKDLNLNTLAETGSIEQAMIKRDEQGNITNLQQICDATDYNYNCDDFKTQKEANDVASACEFDVYGLDGDNDGIVCEALPAGN